MGQELSTASDTSSNSILFPGDGIHGWSSPHSVEFNMRSFLVLAIACFAYNPVSLACGSKAQASDSDSTCTTEAPPSGDVDFATLEGERASFSVSGMKCGKCSSKVVAALKAVEGVKGAVVDHAAGNAQVVFEAGKTDATALQAAINALGYTATVAAQ